MPAMIALSTALSACGNSPTTPDGQVTSADAKPIDGVRPADAAPVPVSLTAFGDDGTPAVGLPVAFLNADDSVVLEAVTDSNGSASAAMVAGGSVTLGAGVTVAPNGQTTKPQVFTFLAVQSGDNLIVGSPAPAAAMQQLTVNVPSSDNADSAGVFALGTSCGEAPVHVNVANTENTAISISIPSSCTTADLYLVAIDQNGVPTAGAIIAQQAIPSNSPLAITATFAPLHAVSVSLSDLPGWTATMDIELIAVDGASELFANGQPYTFTGNSSFQTTQSVVDAASIQLVSIVATTEGNGSGVGQVLIQRYGSDADETIDLGNGWLPSIEAQATYDAPSTGVIWTESGSSGPANVAYNKLNLSNSSTRDFEWNVVGPYTSGAQHYPHLPTTLASFNVADGDVPNVITTGIANASIGYDAVRANFFNLLTDPISFVPSVGDQVFFSSGPVDVSGS